MNGLRDDRLLTESIQDQMLSGTGRALRECIINFYHVLDFRSAKC